MYYSKIIIDSQHPTHPDIRLTTFEISIPKWIQGELNTHRMLSKSSASSRAIPFKKILESVKTDPVIPVFWGKNQSGMQANEEVDDPKTVEELWLQARDVVIDYAKELEKQGLHKQIINRILEPWMFTKVIVTSTDWDNFFTLRTHKDAQPEFRHVVLMMKKQYAENIPKILKEGEWHLPYVTEEEKVSSSKNDIDWRLISSARCARVSYLNHDGQRDFIKDLELHGKLIEGKHFSPFEHVAIPQMGEPKYQGNFYGFVQYRKTLKDEVGQSNR